MLCDPPVCYEITDIKIKKLNITNIVVHGGIWCHIFGNASLIKNVVILLAKQKWWKPSQECKGKCKCNNVSVTVNVIADKISVNRYPIWDSSIFPPKGNCRISGNASFEVEIKAKLGLCLDQNSKIQISSVLKEIQTMGKTGLLAKGVSTPETLQKRINLTASSLMRKKQFSVSKKKKSSRLLSKRKR